jgi:hypothetical protein
MKFKYPKFFLFLLLVFVAYQFYQMHDYPPIRDSIIRAAYAGTFFAGMMFSYGFTTPFAVALFLILGQQQNLLLAGLIGGLGALLSDLIIFKFIRHTFDNEIKLLAHEKLILYVEHKLPRVVRHYIVPIIGGFIIASPLPDELGVAILASSLHLSTKKFIVLSYLFNTIGIIIMLAIGSTLG